MNTSFNQANNFVLFLGVCVLSLLIKIEFVVKIIKMPKVLKSGFKLHGTDYFPGEKAVIRC
jgi:hypothetical protein